LPGRLDFEISPGAPAFNRKAQNGQLIHHAPGKFSVSFGSSAGGNKSRPTAAPLPSQPGQEAGHLALVAQPIEPKFHGLRKPQSPLELAPHPLDIGRGYHAANLVPPQ
jgi:hypothetical protein